MPRAIKFCLLLLAAFLSAAAGARAVLDDYSPFASGEKLTPFPLVEIPASLAPRHDKDPKVYEFTNQAEKGKTAVVKIVWPDDGGGASTTLFVNKTKVFSGQIKGLPLGCTSAYRADLNGDGIIDYVMITSSGGNGLAGVMYWVTLLLSSPSGYAKVDALSWGVAPADFVTIGGRAYLVNTSFVSGYGEPGKDGRGHNYWVCNLLRIDGQTLVLDNAADRRFPKWVLYTLKPNRRDTDQLTPEQRERLWRQYLKENPWSVVGG